MSANGHRWFAWFYDRISRSMERGPLGAVRSDVLAGLTGVVIEIGAGTGLNFSHYPAEVRVIAFEPDPHMRKRAEKERRANIDLRAAPAERLPVADASADAVVTTLVLCTVDDVAASLAEAKRVLRPGGELRFIEHVRGEGALGTVQDVVQPVYGWFSGGCHGNRRTERALLDAGYTFERLERGKLNPMTHAIWGVARPGVTGARVFDRPAAST